MRPTESHPYTDGFRVVDEINTHNYSRVARGGSHGQPFFEFQDEETEALQRGRTVHIEVDDDEIDQCQTILAHFIEWLEHEDQREYVELMEPLWVNNLRDISEALPWMAGKPLYKEQYLRPMFNDLVFLSQTLGANQEGSDSDGFDEAWLSATPHGFSRSPREYVRRIIRTGMACVAFAEDEEGHD